MSINKRETLLNKSQRQKNQGWYSLSKARWPLSDVLLFDLEAEIFFNILVTSFSV